MVQPLMVHLWVKLSACVKDLGNRQQAAFRHLTTCFCLRSLSRSVPGGLRPVTAHEHGALGGQRAQTTPSPDRHSVGKRKAGAELGQRACLLRHAAAEGRLTPSALLLRSCTHWPNSRSGHALSLTLPQRKEVKGPVCF